jgi:hypothetical protein
VAPRLVSWQRGNQCRFCSQDLTTCFILWPGANGLHSQLLLKASKGMENSGPHTANQSCDWFPHYGQEVRDHIPYTSDFHLFALHNKHLAEKQFAAVVSVEKPVSSYLQTLDTNILCRWMPAVMPQWDKCLICSGHCMEVWYAICHVYTEIRIKFLISKCLLPPLSLSLWNNFCHL